MLPRRTWQRRCQGRGIERPQENSRVIHHCRDLDRKSLTHWSSFGSACCRTPWNIFHLTLLQKLTFTLRRFSFRYWGLPGPSFLRRALVRALSTAASIAETPSLEEPKMQHFNTFPKFSNQCTWWNNIWGTSTQWRSHLWDTFFDIVFATCSSSSSSSSSGSSSGCCCHGCCYCSGCWSCPCCCCTCIKPVGLQSLWL